MVLGLENILSEMQRPDLLPSIIIGSAFISTSAMIVYALGNEFYKDYFQNNNNENNNLKISDSKNLKYQKPLIKEKPINKVQTNQIYVDNKNNNNYRK